MTYTINIGKKQVWDVSNSTRKIFSIVTNKLESGKEGSKFKYFNLLGNEGTIPYKKSTLDSILNDFDRVKQELNLVKCPVASYYIKNMELGYANGFFNKNLSNFWKDEWTGSKEKGVSIDEKGLVIRIGDILSFEKNPEYKYFKELKKGDEYFNDFLELGRGHIPYFKLSLNKVDKIEHNFKSAGFVWRNILEKLEEFVEKAKKEKKSIRIC